MLWSLDFTTSGTMSTVFVVDELRIGGYANEHG